MCNNKVGFELAVGVNEDSTQALLQFCRTPIVWTEVYPTAVVVIGMQIIPDDWLPLQHLAHLTYTLRRDSVADHSRTYDMSHSGRYCYVSP